jgi:hypothetical protein
MSDGEILIAHTRPLRAATHVRSTLIQSSVNMLKARGHFDSYVQLLPEPYHEAILGTVAAAWMPIDVGIAHYRTCDALALSTEELLAIGEAVGDRIQGVFLKTLTQAVRGAGVNPWMILKRFDRLWARLVRGGSVQLVVAGPKDAAIEVLSSQLPHYQYFRTGFCGVVRAGFKLAGVEVVYVKVSRWDRGADRFVMRAAWV